MPKPVHYSPILREVRDGTVTYLDCIMRLEQLDAYEGRTVKLDPVIDVMKEIIVGFGIYDEYDEYIGEADYTVPRPPYGIPDRVSFDCSQRKGADGG